MTGHVPPGPAGRGSDGRGSDGRGSDGRGSDGRVGPTRVRRVGTGSDGAVVLVGTPIGNLEDLSPRAVAALATAATIYCEDTRRTRGLLAHAGVTGVPLRSLHQHNEAARTAEVLAAVSSGERVAVVSDAGMPGVSDPGSRVVAAAAEAGLTVTVVPGPSAVLGALVVSGFNTDRFCFEGFLPRSGAPRRRRLAALATEERTTVIFEAPPRVAATLDDLASACGPSRRVVVVRELTKLHEEVWRGELAEAAAWAGARPPRGEVVVVLDGAPEGAGGAAAVAVGDDILAGAVTDRVRAGERTRTAVEAVAAEFGVPKRRVYRLAHAGPGAPGPSGAPATPGTTEETRSL